MIQFLQRYGVRIVIVIALFVAAYGAIHCFGIYRAYYREQRIAKRIKDIGGFVSVQYRGPAWIPKQVRDKLPYLTTIDFITLNHDTIPADLSAELGLLTGIRSLVLDNTQVGDADLAHVRRLITLRKLALDSTLVTDDGLKLLKDLRSLKRLDIAADGVTAKGRAELRQALPNCQINPDP